MGRTFKNIQIKGKEAYVLFDTGSMRSYIREEFASQVRLRTVPATVGLEGRSLKISEVYLLNYAIDGLQFDIEAHPVEEIGTDEKGKRIDGIIGALAMEKWGLTPDPRTGLIDLTLLRKREFSEF